MNLTPLAGIEDVVMSERDFDRVASIIHADAGIALTSAKKSLVYSRLAKRVRALGLSTFSAYCDFVETPEGEDERGVFLSALTTNVTYFFREPHHFDDLRENILPGLVRKAEAGGRVRLWSAGCSTGQEPYCLALTTLSVAPNIGKFDFKILATDIDPEVLATAERGVYDDSLIANISAHDQSMYFQSADHSQVAVKPNVRSLISFRRMNLIEPWPVKGPFDVIFCRNVVIYFDQETQEMVWSRFAKLLDPQGKIYVGHSERVSGSARALLKPDGVTAYRKQPV
ncbi:MAG: protein-glutamate O-methyltransferase [Pseudomonadota bacterium]